MIDLDAIKGRDAAATPGPWYWGGNLSAKSFDLRARVSNTPIVMAFRRWGNGCEPCFWKRTPEKDPAFHGEYQRARDIAVREKPYRDDVAALDNADAAFIAAARTDVPALVAEVERLRAYIVALLDHGTTTWSDTSCGRGGVGGRAMTTTAHPDVIQHLALSALHGATLTEAADQYAEMLPNTARLDEKPRRARRAGADGRPV